ncbi:MAG: aminoacyl-histidine dipeptidase [Acidobacteriota bacterium]
MSSPLQALEPQPIWSHFDAIRQVPRPSKHEERIAEHVRTWAAEHGFAVRADTTGNLVVTVPASPGHEKADLVVLQAHLDMVCEKNAGVEHDFMNEPIRVTVEGDWVKAVGTTLGADNGLGAAAAMAVAVDPEVVHGPLELLFTLDEETGLNGASALDPAIVTGRVLINLDTEEDDAVYIGCAGAAGIEGVFSFERSAEPGAGELVELAVTGLRGGHSGMDIIENRGNASKIAARLLVAATEAGVDVGLIAFAGGSKRNAIARECFVQLRLEVAARQRLEELAAVLRDELMAELGAIEPQLSIELRQAPSDAPSWGPIAEADRDRLLQVILATPHGVLTLSREVPGLVETSNNLAVVTVDESEATLLCSLRSSVTPALTGTLQTLRSLFRLAGGQISEEAGYPGWKPNPESPVVRRTVAAYTELFGEPPAIKAVHAGLECGILSEKIPGLDAVSIGPEIRNAHSPDEKARISSSARFYRLLKRLLADLATTQV